MMLVTPSEDYYLVPAWPEHICSQSAPSHSERTSSRTGCCVRRTSCSRWRSQRWRHRSRCRSSIRAPSCRTNEPWYITPQAQGTLRCEHHPLPQLLADQLGWHDFVREVGTAYNSAFQADVREKTSILVGNYGEAAALDVYGSAYDLPPALSGHNQYYLWALRGQHPENVLSVQFNLDQARPFCRSVRVLATTASPYAMAYENGQVIAFCGGVHPPLATLWPKLKNFN